MKNKHWFEERQEEAFQKYIDPIMDTLAFANMEHDLREVWTFACEKMLITEGGFDEEEAQEMIDQKLEYLREYYELK